MINIKPSKVLQPDDDDDLHSIDNSLTLTAMVFGHRSQ